MNLASKRRWWHFARLLQTMPLEERKRLLQSKFSRAHLARIARLHPTHGEALDEVRAPLRVHAFVAYAPDRPELPILAGQRARFEAVMDFFEERTRWPHPRELPVLAKQVDDKWLGAPTAPRSRRAHPDEAPDSATERRKTLDAALAIATAMAGQNPQLANILEQVKSIHRQA